jgi:hypothetical protein
MPAGSAKTKSAEGSGSGTGNGKEFENALDGKENLEEGGHLPGDLFDISASERDKTLIERIKKQFPGIGDADAENLAHAAYGFSRGFDYYINNAQYAWIKGEELTQWGEMALNRAAWLETHIEKSPKFDSKQTLYRGMSDNDGLHDYFMNAKVGEIYAPKQLSSTTTNERVAKKFAMTAKSILLEIEGPHRTGASMRHLSHFAAEDEVVFSARSRFKIISKSIDSDGRLRVKVKVAAPDKKITKKLRDLKLKPIDNKADIANLGKLKEKKHPAGFDQIVKGKPNK